MLTFSISGYDRTKIRDTRRKTCVSLYSILESKSPWITLKLSRIKTVQDNRSTEYLPGMWMWPLNPTSTQDKNEWSYTSTPAICFYGADRGLHISKCRNGSRERRSLDLNTGLADVTLSPDPSHLTPSKLCASYREPGRGYEKKNFYPFREPNPGRPDISVGTMSTEILRFVRTGGGLDS
jgi:hypothetical protein